MLSTLFMTLWQTISTWDVVGTITIIILISSFFEKLFDKKFIGRWFFAVLWRILKFVGRRLSMPFRPELDKIKEYFAHAKVMEAKIQMFMDGQKSQVADFVDSLELVKNEVMLNSGKSIKDQINYLVESDGEKRDLLQKLLSVFSIYDLRLNIADEAANRMSLRLDQKLACIYISDNFLRFFGYTEKDMKGLDWDFCIARNQLSKMRREWKKALERRTQYRNDQIIVDSAGQEHRCLVRGFPIIESDEMNGFYCTVELLDDDD